jgi:hypothetical protein
MPSLVQILHSLEYRLNLKSSKVVFIKVYKYVQNANLATGQILREPFLMVTFYEDDILSRPT